jgi:thioredoxin reductase
VPDDVYDVAVIGGGPAGLAAAVWAARYRRRVVVVDDGAQRNRWTEQTHGYLGLECISPGDLLERAQRDLTRYPEVVVREGRVTAVSRRSPAFCLEIDRGGAVHALRLVLATGVRDELPTIERFEQFYGSTVFTCPSCDGYEAQGRRVAVIGDDQFLAGFAIGLLDWAAQVTVVAADDAPAHDALRELGIEVEVGRVASFEGDGRRIHGLVLADGRAIACDMVFCTIGHVQHSPLASALGCRFGDEGTVTVDEHGLTSVDHVYAAGDMTPGPHLVQVAAAKGAVAGIAAAISLRGEAGAPTSPPPAPDPADVLPD